MDFPTLFDVTVKMESYIPTLQNKLLPEEVSGTLDEIHALDPAGELIPFPSDPSRGVKHSWVDVYTKTAFTRIHGHSPIPCGARRMSASPSVDFSVSNYVFISKGLTGLTPVSTE